jgi:hypothetical protein
MVHITNPHTRRKMGIQDKEEKRRGPCHQRVVVASAVPTPLSSCHPCLPCPRPRFVILVVIIAGVHIASVPSPLLSSHPRPHPQSRPRPRLRFVLSVSSSALLTSSLLSAPLSTLRAFAGGSGLGCCCGNVPVTVRPTSLPSLLLSIAPVVHPASSCSQRRGRVLGRPWALGLAVLLTCSDGWWWCRWCSSSSCPSPSAPL